MNRNSLSLRVVFVAFIAATLSLGALAMAASTEEIDADVAATLTRFYAQDKGHRDLAQKAAAILVFPQVTKAGVGVGGEYGEGALEIDGKTVGYYRMTDASLGATLGAAHRSEVILFMTDDARAKFMNSRDWTIGVDAGVAIVKGAGVKADTETLRRPVVAFVFGERGLIADVSMEGAKVSKLPR